MSKGYLLIIALLLTPFALKAQNVTNVSAMQRGKNVEISYDLDKNATINICYSTDGGRTYSAPLQKVSGDVGKGVTAGHKTIIWDVLSEVENLVCSNLIFKVITGDNETFVVNGVTFEMVYVEGGTFMMGGTKEQGSDAESDEKPIHSVKLSSFYIGKYEVTQGLWNAVMETNVFQQRDKANPSWGFFGLGDDYPMYYVSWDECKTFILRLNQLLSSQLDGRQFALPTEAQWEYAARGGNKSMGYKYAGSNIIDEVAWYKTNSNNKTHKVGTKIPNELGLYDMSGNIWEWCMDWYGSYSSGSLTNPAHAFFGSDRVFRGGGWSGIAKYSRVSDRTKLSPSSRGNDLGLRLVLIP